MIRRPPRSTLSSSSAASDVYKRQVRRHEGVGDGLIETAAGQSAPDGAPHLLRLGQAAGRAMPRERLRRQMVADDTPDLLDEVDLAHKVGAERRGRDRPLRG